MTRRTMYIRYNGLLDGQPSFTTLYSRCVHLGCPVQPNGPVEDDRKKTVGENVTLIPVLAVGFGCPCHGGQYDTEGNRTAGPPVRALDRAEFAIVNGNLFLGPFFSVSEVEGAGARARIKKYGRSVPGVHVDGPRPGSTPSRCPSSGRQVDPPAATRDGRALPAQLARGALRARRRRQVLPLPQGPARHGLVPHARVGDPDRVHRPGGHRRRARDVLQARSRQGLRVDPVHHERPHARLARPRHAPLGRERLHHPDVLPHGARLPVRRRTSTRAS